MLCTFRPFGALFRCESCQTVKRQPTRRNCIAGGGVGDLVAGVAKAFGVRPCGGCKKRRTWLNNKTPWRKGADVVLLFSVGADTDWMEKFGDLVGELLEENGKSAFIAQVASRDGASLLEMVKTLRPKLVINHAFLVDQEQIGQAAREYPGTRFVTVNHSSYAYTQSNDNWIRQQAAAIELAKERENCFLAHVDERAILKRLGLTRCFHLPNVVTSPEAIETPVESLEEPLVSIAGRWHMVKNQLQQMIAVAMVKDARALLVMKRGDDLQEITANALGLDFEQADWQPWRDWHKLIASRVAVGMQASFSESFNYVALEHLQLGRPVVGSPAVRYLPGDWKVDPDSPSAIADLLRSHLADLAERSEQAKAIAAEVKERNNSAFLETIDRLLARKVVL